MKGKGPKVKCDNCHRVFPKGKIKVRLSDAPRLNERLDPGWVVPFGECPVCSAFVYRIKEGEEDSISTAEKRTPRVVIVLEGGLVRGVTSELPVEVMVKDIDEGDPGQEVVYTHWGPDEITTDPGEIENAFRGLPERNT